jgi:hypothetical protein
MWWMKLQRDGLFSEYFGLSPSVSFQYSIAIHSMQHMREGERGRSQATFGNQCAFGNRGALDREVLVSCEREIILLQGVPLETVPLARRN